MFQHGQDFSNFPFDGKMFVLELESFSFTGKDILYNWKDFTEELKNYKAFQLSPEIGFYDFSLVGHRIQNHLVSLITDINHFHQQVQEDLQMRSYISYTRRFYGGGALLDGIECPTI